MWTVDDGTEVTATFQGFTAPLRDLYTAIAQRGWEISKVKWGSDGFEAEAKNPTTGAKLKRVAPTEDAAVAHLLLSVTRSDFIHARAARVKLGMWQTTFVDKLTEIAEAYAKAPVYEPKAVGAWMELAHDSQHRFEVLQGEMQIEVVDESDPYSTLEEMCKDVHSNKHLFVTRASADHPVWSVDQFVAFRAVHDVLGHCASGGDFGWHGENQACAAHFPLLSPNAQQALFTEAIGRSAYQTFFKGHGPRKIALLDDFMEEAQGAENSAGHQGVHPSQSLPPTEVPHAPITASSPALYHVAPRSARESIAAHGIDAARGVRRWEHDYAPGNYLYSDLDEAHEYGRRELSEPYDVWHVDPSGLDISNDPETDEGSDPRVSYPEGVASGWQRWHAAQPIPADRLTLLSEDPRGPRTASFHRNAGYIDPNDGWGSGVEPIVGVNGQPWRSIENDPLGIHRPNAEGVSAQDQASNLARIDPSHPDKRWWDLEHHDGTPNREQMRHAIVNAFAATLLAPNKDSRWHATHYQDIADLAHSTEDPDDLHARLEQRRIEHNRAKRISPLAHRPYYREQQDFAQFLKASSPTSMTDAQAQVKAHREVQRLLETEKRRLADEAAVAEAGKAPEKRTPLSQIEIKAGQEVARILRDLVNPAHDPATDFSERPALHEAAMTQKKLLEMTQGLPEDQSQVVHQFPDGWSIRELGTYGDLHREGTLMSNCWARPAREHDPADPAWTDPNRDDYGDPLEWGHPDHYIPGDNETIDGFHYSDDRYLSLRDPDNVPHLSFHAYDRSINNVLGRHNSQPKWEHVKRLQDWVNHQRAEDEYWTPTHYYDSGPGHDHPWPRTPLDDWFQHHYDWEHQTGQFGYQASAQEDPTEVVAFDGEVNPEALGAYGSWMHDHLKSIARVNRHSDAILDAALKDLNEREGAGHHFRAYVNSLGLPGVGPQATSFAWHLLAPERSQLASIDGHMLEALGRKPDEHPSPRDYFKLERELRARLDAAGYHDVPLGLAQTALWDYKVHGPDHHQDLAALRPLNHVQAHRVDWPARKPQGKPSKLPDPWWKETEGIGTQIGDHFDHTVGSKFRADEIPFQDDRRYLPVTAATQSADELHLAWPLPANVRTQIANWISTVEWPDGVELEDPAKYHITAVYAEGGWNDKATHALIRQQTTTDIPFESTGLELFGPDKDTVVIRLESEQADKWANTLMDQAEGMGIDVSRYPGGYKPHITVATGASDLPDGEEITLSFRGGKLYVSTPRDIADKEEEREVFSALELPAPAVTHPDGESDVGAPGETIMQYLRGQLGLTTEQAWEFEGDVRKIGP